MKHEGPQFGQGGLGLGINFLHKPVIISPDSLTDYHHLAFTWNLSHTLYTNTFPAFPRRTVHLAPPTAFGVLLLLYSTLNFTLCLISQMVHLVKNLPANVKDTRDVGSIPELGRSPGGRNSNPLQYSCLENPMDRGARRATVHRVAKSQTRMSTPTRIMQWLSNHDLGSLH